MEGKHILLTGSAGTIGSVVLLHLLNTGYTVTSIDLRPLPPKVLSSLPRDAAYTHHILDLTDYTALDAIFDAHGPFSGVIHLSAIPAPIGDLRNVHNVNVTTSYNVLSTAANRGVKRIVQASSVNAPGLSFTPEGRQRFDELPVKENAPMRAMDCYALSKQINEIQAECLVRTDPTVRIASLRFHYVTADSATATPVSDHIILWGYTSYKSCATACLLALTSEGWEGAQAFNIVAPEICYSGSQSPEIPGHAAFEDGVGTVELVQKVWGDRIARMREGWWDGRPRRGCWDTGKAESLLGWVHEE